MATRAGPVLSAMTILTLALPAPAAVLRGRVVVDDGIPPATPIRVELRCPGAAPVTAPADSEGRFELPEAESADCTITAVLAGYAGETIGVDRLPLDAGIGALALRREGKWQGHGLSSTTLSASAAALSSFAGAVAALRAGGQANMAKAEEYLVRAVEQDSQFAEAWFQLARLQLARGDAGAARASLRGSLAADRWYISPYRPLLMLELADERWAAARDLCRQWLQLTPAVSDALVYGALSELELNNVEGAREQLRELEEGPEGESFFPVHYLRGRIHERERQREKAAAEYRKYLELDGGGPFARDAGERLAKEEPR
jgi:hypothetical protein